MTGVAAFALCAGFTSCSHDMDGMSQEELNDHYVQKIVESYEKAFIENIGQPAPNQDWGFGTTTNIRTRAGSNDNKNQWGNPNYGNWKVPAPLTAGQSIRVKAYFQQNPNLTFTPPTYDTYFVQQVYKGNTSANTAFSKEYYFAANNDTVIGSGHMDKLTVGSNMVHVDNFNYGTYNGGDSLRVLNTGATDDSSDANFHNDMITLIEGVVPTCVGFHDSEGSVQHNDHAALVAASVIDAWAEANKAALQARGEYGEAVVDEWNRSFVGLDYESKVPDDIYLKVNGQKVNATISQCCPSKDYVYDGTTYYTWDQAKDMVLTTPGGKTFPLIDTNSNTYLGERVTIDQNDMFTDMPIGPIMDSLKVSSIYGRTDRNSQIQVLDLTKVFARLGTGNYAAINNAHGNFVTKLGGRDYVFSDWIVTLSEAQRQGTTNPPVNPPVISSGKIRVIAEDLTATSGNDFDFNDVVFDVTYGEANEAKITVQAAGGTLPLRIKVGAGDTEADYQEVHALWEQSPAVMINTNAENRVSRGRGVSGLPAKDVTLGYAVKTPTDVRDKIKIEVQKTVGNTLRWVELQSVTGQPAAKIAVNPNWHWLDERVNITGVQGFVDYVTNRDTWEGSLP